MNRPHGHSPLSKSGSSALSIQVSQSICTDIFFSYLVDLPKPTLLASILDGPNYECRGSSSDLLKQALLLTFSQYVAAAFLTCLTRRGKRIGASEGMNGFESAVVSTSDFAKCVVEEVESPCVKYPLLLV